MQIITSEINEPEVKKLNLEHAVPVAMDDIQVTLFNQQHDGGKTLLYTEGVGPCITVIMCGEIQKNPGSNAEVQTFVVAYHWSGGTKKQLEDLRNLPSQLRGLALAEHCYADIIDHIKTELCDVTLEELKNYKLVIDDIAIVGGERKQEQLSGSETQVRGLCEFLRSFSRKKAFKDKYGVYLPEFASPNVHVFRTADEKFMDIYVSLDTRGDVQITYHIQNSVLLNKQFENKSINHGSDSSDNDDTSVVDSHRSSAKRLS